MTTDLAIDAIEMAIRNRRPSKGLMHHSDQGVQYASNANQKVLKKHHMVCSMSRKGNCWDNAVMESFFSTLKLNVLMIKYIYLELMLNVKSLSLLRLITIETAVILLLGV